MTKKEFAFLQSALKGCVDILDQIVVPSMNLNVAQQLIDVRNGCATVYNSLEEKKPKPKAKKKNA